MLDPLLQKMELQVDSAEGDWEEEEALLSIPDLFKRRDERMHEKCIEGIKSSNTSTLILRIHVTTDALTLWEIHKELHDRGVAPCFRWPCNESTSQAAYVTWLADLIWICHTGRHGAIKHRDWRCLTLRGYLKDDAWHRKALQLFQRADKCGLSSYCARVLGLSDEHRQMLMTLTTKEEVRCRASVHGDVESRAKLSH